MRQKLGTISLALCVFFLPLGYDLVFWVVQEWTGSYAATTFLFYLLAVLFFGLYIYLHKINLFSHAKEKAVDKKNKIKKIIKKN
jgi:hypothetical protein